MLEEPRQGLGAEPAHRFAVSGGESFGEEIGEQRNIFAVFAQWRQEEADGGEAAGQIGSQSAGGDELAQGLTGEAENLTRDEIECAQNMLMIDPLQKLEQPGLIRRRQLIDAGEDERSAAGLLQSGNAGEFQSCNGLRGDERDGLMSLLKKSCVAGQGTNDDWGSDPNSCRVRAASIFPTPLSPSRVAIRRWRAVCRICEKSLCITRLRPIISPKRQSGGNSG